METVENTDLEKLAQQAAGEDAPKPDDETAGKAGDHLPADVERMRAENAAKRAEQLMGVLEWALKKKDDRLSLPESAYTEAGARLSPLILKYNLDEYGLPDWLKPYQEEVSAAVFLFSIGAGVGMQLYMLRQADREAGAAHADAVGEVQQHGKSAFGWAKDEEQ